MSDTAAKNASSSFLIIQFGFVLTSIWSAFSDIKRCRMQMPSAMGSIPRNLLKLGATNFIGLAQENFGCWRAF
jgi:hypothetical protein